VLISKFFFQMKLIAVFAVLLVASANVEAKSLGEAMIELRQAMRLHSWVAAWNVRRNADNAVCAYSNRLNQPDVLPQAARDIDADPFYQRLETAMNAAGVPWQAFMDEELLPALGAHAIVPTCTTLSSGGVLALRNQLKDYFDEDYVKATVDRLVGESPEFAEIMGTISQNQAEVKRIRCMPSVQRVYDVKRAEGVDFDFVFQILEIIFGWPAITSC
jgi:hypothetical protein